MARGNYRVRVLRSRAAVVHLPWGKFPGWPEVTGDGFLSLTLTDRGVTVVCAEECVPDGVESRPGWRILEVEGTFDFQAVGVLADLSASLARAVVPIYAVSTHPTDYILVAEADLPRAVAALERDGDRVRRE